MKYLFIITMLLLIPVIGQSQYNTGVKGFYHKYKKSDNTVRFVLPGFLVWMGSGIAKEVVDDPAAKVVLRFAKKFKTMRVLTMEDGSQISKEDYLQLIYSAKQKNYEELIAIKSAGNDVHIMARSKKDKLKNILIIVKSEEEGFTLLDMKAKVRPKDLNRMINDLMKLEKVREKIKPMSDDEKDKLNERLLEQKKEKKARA